MLFSRTTTQREQIRYDESSSQLEGESSLPDRGRTLTGRHVLSSEKELSDTNRAVRICLLDDGQETNTISRPLSSGAGDEDPGYRVYDVLEFGRFLRRRIYKIKT